MTSRLAAFCEKVIEAGWLAAVIAVPLFFNIYTARTFEPDKITLLRSIAIVMLLAWGVIKLDQIANGPNGNGSPTTWSDNFKQWLKQPFVTPVLFLVIIYIISTAFSISPRVSLWGSYQRLQGTYSALSYIAIFAMMAGHLRTRAQVDRLITAIIVTSIPVSLYGIVQKYGLDPLPWAGNVTERVASTMGNSIFVASYLIMVIPLTLSRLVESMTAIIKDEAASWGYTILSAVYIFALAVQILTVIFTQSRGPMLGVLGGVFMMGLLILMILRQRDEDKSALSGSEVSQAFLSILIFVVVAGVAGGLGFLVGRGMEGLLLGAGYQVENVTLIGAALGGILGFLGSYTYMATSEKGWRWMWLSWVGVGVLALVFVVTLNIRSGPLETYLAPVRSIPYLNRLASVAESSGGTGRVRVLIWDAAIELIAPHEPLGISNDPVAQVDDLNFLRPFIGYGPESMFNAFAFVYPPDLAYAESRGSSADRSHNETVDSLVITGLFGFIGFYFLMATLFSYTIIWLGWAANQMAKRQLMTFLVGGTVLGGGVAYFADGGDLTFIPLGLPFGMIAGAFFYLGWQGFRTQQPAARIIDPQLVLLMIGIMGAIVGHFVEVHFVFSIAATYTYFWVYAGLIIALARIGLVSTQTTAEDDDLADVEAGPVFIEQQTKAKRSKKTRRRISKRLSPARSQAHGIMGESWEVWFVGQGLVMAIILMILTFDFITPQFQFVLGDQNSMSLLWMLTITWLIGFAIALSDMAIRQGSWRTSISWPLGVFLYIVASLAYFGVYYLAHRIQFGQRISVQILDDVIRAANVLANGLVVFYIFLLLLLLLFALILSWQQARGPFFGKVWWAQVGFILVIIPLLSWYFIWQKNIDVVRADAYLKEGNRYRGQNQWDQAIVLHDLAREIDTDEDFYYLMLALDYQLMAQDGNLDEAIRAEAWKRGEDIALEARTINPYNPDNTGNMGRYYFTIGQVFDQTRFNDALEFFEKATVLAPSNVIYHNLWAQTYYILQNYEQAQERLQASLAVDPNYAPTWTLLGDTYAAEGKVDEALEAHEATINLQIGAVNGGGFAVFADQFLDQRLNFYISAGRLEDIVGAMEAVWQQWPENEHIPAAIARAYILAGQADKATEFLEESINLGNNSDQSIKQLANSYLTNNEFEQALPLYEFLVQNAQSPDIEVFSALGYIQAQMGNLGEAIHYNELVLQQTPNDYDSLKNLALLYRDVQDVERALQMARQAQTVAPAEEAASWDQFITELESFE